MTAANLVGDSTCVGCHAEMNGFITTAHARTSAPATADNIAGSFAAGENVLLTANAFLHYHMAATDSGFRQRAVQLSGTDTVVTDERFDVVTGSGRKGQTYLYWRDDRLYQLPVSYWRGIGWANSPGYPDGMAIFSRPVTPRCLECHATFAEAVQGPGGGNRYDPESMVLGISCESCHGPGRDHVAAERSPLAWLRPASAIIDPGDLPRERELDGCAICHGGIGEPVLPPFSYRPGEPLSIYLHQPAPAPGEAVDVHGNQVALLARSPCFQQSQMTCSTCHDVHRPQRELAEFSATCVSCHAPGDELPADHGAAMPGNCVDCHMPELPTNVIVTDGAGGTLQPSVRTHWIAIYPDGGRTPAVF